MPLLLLHGPAGSGKTDSIFADIKSRYIDRLEAFHLIVPTRRRVEEGHKRIISEKKSGGILSEPFIFTFDDFLLRVLKANMPRVHRASLSLCRNVIRKLLHQKTYPAFAKTKHYFRTVSQLARTFSQLKSNGLGPSEALTLFKSKLTPELTDLCLLFEHYEEQMTNLDYYDEGSLVLATLRLLRQKTLKLPSLVRTLYFDRHFPLSWGQREIIKNLNHIFKDLEIVVSYSFDYKEKDDPYFYPTYSFLGETAARSQHYSPLPQKREEELIPFPDPASELEWVAESLANEHQQGMPLESMGVVLPRDSFYRHRLAELLAKRGMAFRPRLTRPLSHPEMMGLLDAENVVPVFLKHQTTELRDLLASLKSFHEFENQWAFEDEIALHDFGNTQVKDEWKRQEFKRLFIEGGLESTEGVSLFSVDEAASEDFDVLFVCGFTTGNYPSKGEEHPYYTPEMLMSPEMREILEGPEYNQIKEQYLLAQVVSRTKHAVRLTYPRLLWNGQEQFASDIYGAPTSEKVLPAFKPPSVGTGKKVSQVDFPYLKITHFSLSALETYHDCPFKYYARYHLKLGDATMEEKDIPADARGSFVHRVLERLFKENGDMYTEAVDYDLYLARLKKMARQIVDEEKTRDACLAVFPVAVTDSFCDRAAAVIGELVSREIEAIRQKKKKTRPRHFEWNFGRGGIPPLRLTFGKQEITLSGRIDRIDVNDEAKTYSIIDYKTGELDSGAKIKNGESFQVPLYLIAAGELLFKGKGYRPAGGYLVGLKDLSKQTGLTFEAGGEEEMLPKNFRMNSDQWAELKRKITTNIGALLEQISQGNFKPRPKSLQSCRRCDYEAVCQFDGRWEEETDN